MWRTTRQLCYLGGHAPQSGEKVDILQKFKDDHATLVQVKESEEVAIVTATIESNFRQGDLETKADGMKGDLTETETESNEKSTADELRSRSLLKRSPPQSMRRFLWPGDSTGGCAQRKSCGWLAKAQVTARWDAPTAPRQCCGFSIQDSLMSSLFLSLRHRNPEGT